MNTSRPNSCRGHGTARPNRYYLHSRFFIAGCCHVRLAETALLQGLYSIHRVAMQGQGQVILAHKWTLPRRADQRLLRNQGYSRRRNDFPLHLLQSGTLYYTAMNTRWQAHDYLSITYKWGSLWIEHGVTYTRHT